MQLPIQHIFDTPGRAGMNMQVPNIFGTRQGSATQAPVGTAGRGDGIPGSDEPDLIIHGRGIPGPQALWQILQMAQLDDCPHTFHYQCIFEWGKYNQICPVCRKEIPVI
jgi:hypothetical protein